MHKVSRSIFTGLLLVAGLTACGDKVTVTGNGSGSGTGAGVVHSVTVAPASVSLKVGETVQLVASVDADAGLARTVTWASGDATKASVVTGLVTAKAAGTVAITATSTADNTVAGAATIIIAQGTAATISINSINANATGLPANLLAVAGQLDVILNVDQGTQSVSELDLIVHNNVTNTDTTVATYMYTSPNKAPVSATSAPITMSFNTAAFNQTSGMVSFVNGSYSIKAKAVIAGGSGQSPVSSSMNYIVNNADFLGVLASATNIGSDANGLAWVGGTLSYNLVPVLYSGSTLKSATVNPPAADVVASAQTVTTFPATVTFSAGTKDTLTYNPYTATYAAVYSNGAGFTGAATPLTGSLATPIRVDWMAPAQPATFKLRASASQWINGSYAFGNSTDYALVAAPTDPGAPSTPGSGAVKANAHFWAFPSGSFTALGAAKSGAACKTAGATMVTTGANLAQSAANDSTTYNLRVLQLDNVGNIVCADLGALNAGKTNFGVDLGAPVSAKFTSASAGKNAGAVNALLKGTNGGYNVGDFNGFTPTAVDSISGFSLVNDVTQTVSVNDVTTPATKCSVGTTANGCTVQSGAGVLFATTGTGGINDEGYYTIGASIADRAGNSVALPGTVIAIDRTAPVSSGGVAIPAALVGGTAISLSGTITDNMTLMSGGGSVQYTSGMILNYDATSSFASAGTFGTLNKTGTATLGVPNLLSALQPGNGALDALAQFNLRGTDEVGLSGSQAVVVPVANITTGAGTGAGANGIWTAADFTAWTVSNAAVNISTAGGANATSVVLTAKVTVPPATGLPFNNVCFYYLDPKAVTTNATPTFQAEWKATGLCVATAATSNNTDWVYTSGAWTPPATLPVGPVQVIAIGFGVNGHASYSPNNANITITP